MRTFTASIEDRVILKSFKYFKEWQKAFFPTAAGLSKCDR